MEDETRFNSFSVNLHVYRGTRVRCGRAITDHDQYTALLIDELTIFINDAETADAIARVAAEIAETLRAKQAA